MLKLNKKIVLGNVVAPVSFKFEIAGCMSYEVLSFLNNTIDVNFYFNDHSCYDNNSTAVLVIMDASKCEKRYDIALEDPCDKLGFEFEPIQNVRGLKFRANMILAPDMDYTYSWKSEVDGFEVKSQSGNEVEFELTKNILPNTNIPIEVTVTNKNGCCVIQRWDQYYLCGPSAQDYNLATVCEKGNIVANQTIVVAGCEEGDGCGNGVAIDWGTLELELPLRVTWENKGGGKIKINFPADFPKTFVTITYCVKDTNNVQTCAELCIEVKECTENKFLIRSLTGELGCTDCDEQQLATPPTDGNQPCLNAPIQFNVEEAIIAGSEINWESFQFIPELGDVLVSSNELVTPNGVWTLGLDRKLIYTPTSYNTIETRKYSLLDLTGKFAQGNVDIFRNQQCLGNESLVTTFSDEVCVKAGESIEFNPLANDVGEYDVNEITIDFPPDNVGFLTVLTGGKMRFTADANYNGQYELNYSVKDINGAESNISVITINVIADIVNDAVNLSVCKSEGYSISLFNLLNTVETGHRWRFEGPKAVLTVDGVTKTYVVGEQLGVTNDPIIDFRESPNNTYVFSYGSNIGSCGNRLFVSVEVLSVEDFGDEIIQEVCVASAPFALAPLVSHLSGGELTNIIPGDIPVDTFNPGIGVGEYIFRYKKENAGAFGDVCDSQVDLKIIVADEVYAGEPTCQSVCSVGETDQSPDYGCRNPNKVIYSPSCPTCLYDMLGKNGEELITIGGEWTLTKAPHNVGNIMFIDGLLHLIKVNQVIPVNYEGCIDLGTSDIGEYVFVYSVGVKGTDCYSESEVTIKVVPAPELTKNVEISLCSTNAIEQLWLLMLQYWEDEGCTYTPPCDGQYNLISGNAEPFNLEGCDASIDPSKALLTNNEAQFILEYKYGIDPDNTCQEGDCPECLTCYKTIQINITVTRDDAAGTGENFTVCKGSCGVNLSHQLVGAVGGGKWKYVGCNMNGYDAIDPDCDSLVDGKSIGYVFGSNVITPNAEPGFYWFEYKVQRGQCCSTTQIIMQVVESEYSGEDGSCNVCASSGVCVDLYELLVNPTPGGVWVNLSNAPDALNPCAGNGNPNGCGEDIGTGDPGFYYEGTFNTTDLVGTFLFYYVKLVQAAEFKLLPSDDCCNGAYVTVKAEESVYADMNNEVVDNGVGSTLDLWATLDINSTPGGVWYFLGSGDPNLDPLNTTPVKIGNSLYAPGSQLGYSDHPVLDLEGQAINKYWFRYKVGAEPCILSTEDFIEVIAAE